MCLVDPHHPTDGTVTPAWGTSDTWQTLEVCKQSPSEEQKKDAIKVLDEQIDYYRKSNDMVTRELLNILILKKVDVILGA
jgi:hypothetical protein